MTWGIRCIIDNISKSSLTLYIKKLSNILDINTTKKKERKKGIEQKLQNVKEDKQTILVETTPHAYP
jgi:hypothetical protein